MEIQYQEQAASQYRAGVCNIGPREIARRRRIGVAAMLTAFGLGAVIVAMDAPPIVRGVVFLPLWVGFISLEQARRKFCAGFAIAGIRSANPTEQRETITNVVELAADRATARWMVIYCGLLAAAITTLFVLLPL